MEIIEIQPGEKPKRGDCSGDASLAHVCSDSEHLFDDSVCEKPENLHVCEKPENLKVNRSNAGSICCGGGQLNVSSEGDGYAYSQHCNDDDTNLCSNGDTLIAK
jgi:hypothetical protein